LKKVIDPLAVDPSALLKYPLSGCVDSVLSSISVNPDMCAALIINMTADVFYLTYMDKTSRTGAVSKKANGCK
jgi:hypothetical protein